MQEETGHGTITSEYELLSNLKEKNDVFFLVLLLPVLRKGFALRGFSWQDGLEKDE